LGPKSGIGRTKAKKRGIGPSREPVMKEHFSEVAVPALGDEGRVWVLICSPLKEVAKSFGPSGEDERSGIARKGLPIQKCCDFLIRSLCLVEDK